MTDAPYREPDKDAAADAREREYARDRLLCDSNLRIAEGMLKTAEQNVIGAFGQPQDEVEKLMATRDRCVDVLMAAQRAAWEDRPGMRAGKRP